MNLTSGDNLETSDEHPSDGDTVQTLHHPLDSNLEISGERPSDSNTVDNRDDCLDKQLFLENENRDQMKMSDQIEVQDQMEVQSTSQPSSSSHNVPSYQLSSLVYSMPESQVNSETEHHLKILPDRVTRGKPKVSYELILKSKSKYPISNYISTIDCQKKTKHL